MIAAYENDRPSYDTVGRTAHVKGASVFTKGSISRWERERLNDQAVSRGKVSQAGHPAADVIREVNL
ncbi:hypothetical protein TNCV_3627911 [Trichonephila clavipes]|nr:hypothetical protein TNCV_3627911 [Trichonephila clavipes]